MSDPSKKEPRNHCIASVWFDLLWKDEVPKWVVEFHVECAAAGATTSACWFWLVKSNRVPAQFPMNSVCFPLPHFQGTTSVCIRPSCAVSIERCILPGAVACGRWVRSALCCVASVAYATSRALYPPRTYANRTFCTRCCNQSFWWATLLVFNSIHWLPWNSWVPAMCFCSAWVMKFNDTCSLQQWKQTI